MMLQINQEELIITKTVPFQHSFSSVERIYYQSVYSDWHIKQLHVSAHASHLQVIS